MRGLGLGIGIGVRVLGFVDNVRVRDRVGIRTRVGFKACLSFGYRGQELRVPFG